MWNLLLKISMINIYKNLKFLIKNWKIKNWLKPKTFIFFIFWKVKTFNKKIKKRKKDINILNII